jgi:hypothetical protein
MTQSVGPGARPKIAAPDRTSGDIPELPWQTRLERLPRVLDRGSLSAGDEFRPVADGSRGRLGGQESPGHRDGEGVR